MINPLEYTNDKSLYPAQGIGMMGGLVGMTIWLFPLNIWAGIVGFFLTIGATAFTAMTTLIVTGFYKRNEIKIQNYLDRRVSSLKFKKNGNKKRDKRAA